MLFLLTLAGSFAFEYLQTSTMQMIGQRIMFDLRVQILNRLQQLDVRFYDRNPVGRLMTRVTTDVDALNELFTSGVVAVFGDAFTLVGIMAAFVWMDWRLALVAFSVLPLIVVITQWFRVNVRDSYRTVRLWIARINAFLQERITGMATVHLFRREARDFAAFDGINGSHRDANIRSIFFYAVFYPAIELVSALASALIIWVGGGWVIQDSLTLGSLVAFLMYAQRFFRPISDMSEKFNVLQGAMASSERIFGVLDTPAQITSPREPLFVSGRGAIAFEHVTFAYNDGEPVLRDVSFRVEPGERVAIVGATGAGKTTIVSLLLRFYDVQQGRITIDGVDIRDIDLSQLGRVRPRAPGCASVLRHDRKQHQARQRRHQRRSSARGLIEAVHAKAFVDRLPDGLATPVAERGATLSVGQKQLLSFARALAFDRPVLVLDEATSSVDTETELLIRDALNVLMQGRTTIAIAHRLDHSGHGPHPGAFHKGQLRESGHTRHC